MRLVVALSTPGGGVFRSGHQPMNKDAEMVGFLTSFAVFPRVFFHAVKDGLAVDARELERKNRGGWIQRL